MLRKSEQTHAERLEAIVALVRKRAPKNERSDIEVFVRRYFRRVAPDDLAEHAVEDLFGAALSHWDFARQRAPGRERLRVFNPDMDEHGWQSTHTVIEIVTDDMPFLVDTVTMAVNRCGLTLHLFVHPIVNVSRDAAGRRRATAEGPALRESFMHVEVDRQVDPAAQQALAGEVARALADVRSAVADWRAMRDKIVEITARLEAGPPPLPADELAEARAFLDWLANDHFTFLGYRDHDLVKVEGEDGLRVVADSGLGLLRVPPDADLSASFAALPPKVRERARARELLVITKSNTRATVHRPGYLDYVGIKRFDAKGEVCGEHRFLGLYTSTAYMALPDHIPLLRRKVAQVIERAGLEPHSHAGKALANILNVHPRDELIQSDVETLYETAIGVLQLGERQRLRLFVRRDPYERFVACLVYAPRERYDTALRRIWQAVLEQAFQGSSSDFDVSLSESVLARVLITVRTTPGAIPPADVDALESRLAAAMRRWDDDLADALIEARGEARGVELHDRFGAAFPAGYRDDFSARAAVPDIALLESLSAQKPLALRLYRPPESAHDILRFKLFHYGAAVTPSDSLPMLERMGLRVLEERPYRVVPAEGAALWIHDFVLQVLGETEVEVDALDEIFEDAFARLFDGTLENDGFNQLVVRARLDADEVTVLRAYARYLQQINFSLSQAYIERTLATHAPIARALVALFRERFDPRGPADADGARNARRAAEIEAEIDTVDQLNEDRVLRQYLALIRATLRTNWFRRDTGGRRRPFLSFKLDSRQVPGMPEPRPQVEIFVYAPRFEGVHLRGGKVARGGLRWSDRHEDFRTEILGLVKAQMVKNTVIVPVGSKGGFVLKMAPPTSERDRYLAEGVACYQDYLRGLLDITDNRVGDTIVPPPDVRRHDDDDPYLVVAADKGTASFSDIANAVSAEYGFWLGDAFASGGSAGYDHKKMGITARGAWESVKRHFRELGVDTQTQAFSVVGIGDMSGDVFGNGMLLSKCIRLVAAFDHRHVFIDPDPDPARSWEERQRLFELPRSSWTDYAAERISKGGGVWPRSAKTIALSDEARRSLGIDAARLSPNELIGAILRAPVDLIYNGGIGTYVKASDESHAGVGDRTNDAVRVDGERLRCKVFAEGGNLGVTQRGRIEFARGGGRINSDAIDNSAGVATSDHEVNIKILLGLAVADGELTLKQRDKLLSEMTPDVARLVLRDNYFQTQSLSITRRMGVRLLDAQTRFMRALEKGGRLSRAIEYLPDDEELEARRARGEGLTTPEAAVLLAYAKLWLYDELLASTLPDDPWVATALARYFPARLRQDFVAYMTRHPLRREIIVSHVLNSMINRVGSSFVHGFVDASGARPADVVRAYLLQREIFDLVPHWQAIEALDNRVADEVQADMLILSGRLTVRATGWFLRSSRLGQDMAATIAHFAQGVQTLRTRLGALLDADSRAQVDALAEGFAARGVPETLARAVASTEALFAALDVLEVADRARMPETRVAGVYFGLAEALHLPWLRGCIGRLPGEGHWPALARAAMRDDLASLQRALTAQVVEAVHAGATPQDLIAAWRETRANALGRAERLIAELRAGPAPDQSMLSVALRELRNLA
ncbi:MAG: NAD-glutamate dehydrogenase [Betaproteobacteria bacterium SG8_39]|nr:MAG: NAD-glutamate dehydrogenase [Betaproteobacteria bacterium SG8_39]